MKRKRIACLLVGTMLVGILPVTAAAAETPSGSLNADEAQGSRCILPVSDREQQIYDALKAQITKVAKEGGSTEFRVDHLDLRYDFLEAEAMLENEVDAMYQRLKHLVPECLYWSEFGTEIEIKEITFGAVDDSHLQRIITGFSYAIRVDSNYQNDGQEYVAKDADERIQTVFQTAEAVVRGAEPLSDREKLKYYKDYICQAVAEDNLLAVQVGELSSETNDVWELISVFDGDPDTMATCEGYARAFQYLCNLSSFSDPDFGCCWLEGMMDVQVDGKRFWHTHNWNQVYLDGSSYLIDTAFYDCHPNDPDEHFFMNPETAETFDCGYTIHTNSGEQTYRFYQEFYSYFEDRLITLGTHAPEIDPRDETIEELQQHLAELQEMLAQAEADRDNEVRNRDAANQSVSDLKKQIDEIQSRIDAMPKEPDETGVSMQMLRLYNPNSGEHFYTANAAERDYLVKLGWKFEGVGWNAPKKSNTPVYRLYNPNAGDHHYTTSIAERNMLLKAGWNDEQIGWYAVDKDKQADAVPVYRQYNPNAKKAGSHNFTKSQGEAKHLVSVGWRDEGIAWYGVKQ